MMTLHVSTTTLLLFLLIKEVQLNENDCSTSDKRIIGTVPFFFIGFLLSFFFFNLYQYFNLPFPYRVVAVTVGLAIGVIFKFVPILEQEIEENIISKPKLLFTLTVPIQVFRIAFNLDSHTFVRSWNQILILAGPGFIISSCFTGFLMMLLMPKCTVPMALQFGAIHTSMYPVEMINCLNEVGQFKPLSVLLQGESIIGDGTAGILFKSTSRMIEGVLDQWYQVIWLFFRFVSVAVLFGYLTGSVLTYLLRIIRDFVVGMTLLSLSSTIVVFYVAIEYLDASGIIAVVVLGLKYGVEKASMTKEIEDFMMKFWDLLATGVDTVSCILAGYLVVNLFSLTSVFRDNTLVVLTYVVSTSGRMFAYLITTPIVSRLGYGLTFTEMVIAVWSGVKGPFPIMTSLFIRHPTDVFRRDVMYHISGLTVLTLFINASTMPYLLKILGVSEISVIRKMNMNSCMRNLQDKREHTIAALKMNRFLSDANWTVVNKVTELKHPYKINYFKKVEDDVQVYTHLSVCPDCKKEITYEPTKMELAAMLREGRMRILKAKKTSYIRQYKSGLVSDTGIRILLPTIDAALDSPDALLELDNLHRYFRREGLGRYSRKILDKFCRRSDCPTKLPKKRCRRICFKIVTNKVFELFLYFCMVFQMILTTVWWATLYKNTPMIIVNVIVFGIFLLEFILKVLAFSWVYICRHGLKSYFSSYWNIFDFCCLLVLFVDVTFILMDLVDVNFEKYSTISYKIVLVAKYVRLIRLIRVLTLFPRLYPILIHYSESKIDEHSAFAYDIGKAIVCGEEEILSMLPQMIDNPIIRNICRERTEADRLEIIKELGIIQKDKPWIAITVKTRQAARSTLNSMKDTLLDMKFAGVIDDFEYNKVMDSIKHSLKRIRSKLKYVEPCSPKDKFKEILWITGNEETYNYVFSHVVTKDFDIGSYVCVDGQLSDNMYLLVIGILKLTYIPKPNILDRLNKYGALPIIDYIKTPQFNNKIEDYILSGNCIGELGVLTDRPYDCNIIAETPSQAYVISKDVVRNAFRLDPHNIKGLEARMWKAISIRLATNILMKTTAYQSFTLAQMQYVMERAFVPKLGNLKALMVNHLIEDIVLLQGLIWDWNTKIQYTAPCYIPRTVHRITFPKGMNFTTSIETKLLLIPAKDMAELDIIETLTDAYETISTASSICLRHTVMKKQILKRDPSFHTYKWYAVHNEKVKKVSKPDIHQPKSVSSMLSKKDSDNIKKKKSIDIEKGTTASDTDKRTSQSKSKHSVTSKSSVTTAVNDKGSSSRSKSKSSLTIASRQATASDPNTPSSHSVIPSKSTDLGSDNELEIGSVDFIGEIKLRDVKDDKDKDNV